MGFGGSITKVYGNCAGLVGVVRPWHGCFAHVSDVQFALQIGLVQVDGHRQSIPPLRLLLGFVQSSGIG